MLGKIIIPGSRKFARVASNRTNTHNPTQIKVEWLEIGWRQWLGDDGRTFKLAFHGAYEVHFLALWDFFRHSRIIYIFDNRILMRVAHLWNENICWICIRWPPFTWITILDLPAKEVARINGQRPQSQTPNEFVGITILQVSQLCRFSHALHNKRPSRNRAIPRGQEKKDL